MAKGSKTVPTPLPGSLKKDKRIDGEKKERPMYGTNMHGHGFTCPPNRTGQKN